MLKRRFSFQICLKLELYSKWHISLCDNSQIKCCSTELKFSKCLSEWETGKTLIRLLLQAAWSGSPLFVMAFLEGNLSLVLQSLEHLLYSHYSVFIKQTFSPFPRNPTVRLQDPAYQVLWNSFERNKNIHLIATVESCKFQVLRTRGFIAKNWKFEFQGGRHNNTKSIII